jgi:hypothetical protein
MADRMDAARRTSIDLIAAHRVRSQTTKTAPLRPTQSQPDAEDKKELRGNALLAVQLSWLMRV